MLKRNFYNFQVTKDLNSNARLTLSHDDYDHLTAVNGTQYLYDGNGTRIKAIDGASERNFLQASQGELDVTELMTDGSGNLISDFVYGSSAVPISRLDANGNPIYYLTDAMGSVIGGDRWSRECSLEVRV